MLVVLLLDSAEADLISKLVTAGKMPSYRSLLETGATVPLLTDSDWLDGSVMQTLLTGVNPGQHGIYKHLQLVNGTYRYVKMLANSSPIPQIWSELSRRGKRCCVFDVPKAYPQPEFNGSLVAAWGAYSPSLRPSSMPKRLLPEIQRRFGAHPHSYRRFYPGASVVKLQSILERLLDGVARRTRICQWLLAQERWDLFMTCFSESHIGGHQFWHLIDESHPLYDAAAARQLEEPLEQIYVAIDRSMTALRESLPSDATLVVLSQQGMKTSFRITEALAIWLRRRGGESRGQCHDLTIRSRNLLGARVHRTMARWLPRRLVDAWQGIKHRPASDLFALAGSDYQGLIRVNLKGREPQGTVDRSDYRATLESLKRDLLQLKDDDTGLPLIHDVVFTHDVLAGDHLDELPDAVACGTHAVPVRAIRCPRLGVIKCREELRDQPRSYHTPRGQALIVGPTIGTQQLSTSYRLQDLNASLYQLMGEPIPTRVEGTSFVAELDQPSCV